MKAAGLTELDGDAVVIRVPGQDVPIMLRKSDGGFGYDSTDLASIKYRLQVRCFMSRESGRESGRCDLMHVSARYVPTSV